MCVSALRARYCMCLRAEVVYKGGGGVSFGSLGETDRGDEGEDV